MCKTAGFEGKFTNHSLRATCATKMYDNDVPEQLIKEIIGHKSECVHTYKRTSDHLRETVSHTLSKVGDSSGENKSATTCFDGVKKLKVKGSKVQNTEEGDVGLSMEQMVANVTRQSWKLEGRNI